MLKLSWLTAAIFLSLFFLSPLEGGRPSSSNYVRGYLYSLIFSAHGELQKLTLLVKAAPNSISKSECLDRLMLADKVLRWSLSNGDRKTTPSTGDHLFDVHSWLTAVTGYFSDCKDELDLTGKDEIANSFHNTSSFVTSALSEVVSRSDTLRGSGGGRKLLQGFPEWVSADDRRLLLSVNVNFIEKANVVVAKDNSGDYSTLGEAMSAAPTDTDQYVIYVKKGIYKEYVEVKKPNLVIVGDGMDKTIFTGDRQNATGYSTTASATFKISGERFIAVDVAFENTAGPNAGPAVAVHADADLSIFYRCRFSGYQDTLFAASLRQFYRECRIFGTVDYIFGNAAAVFQNCDILSLLPPKGNSDVITAHSRDNKLQNSGYSFQFCNVTSADEDLASNGVDTFLGRPWRMYARVVFTHSYLDSLISPPGWLDWEGRGKTAFYGEYLNEGPGSGLEGRVNWTGYHILKTPAEAAPFSATRLLMGHTWLPASGIPHVLDPDEAPP